MVIKGYNTFLDLYETFVYTSYLLNFIALKILQPPQDLVHFLHFFLLCYKIISRFQVFVILAYMLLIH